MLSCAIGFTLLISSVYMMLDDRKSSLFKRFYSVLDERQKGIYDGIVKERLMIYVAGMVLGLVLAFLYYFKNLKDRFRICKFLSIAFTTKLLFYYVMPKKPPMLNSLNEERQVEAWADINSHMKQQWIVSLFVGFIGYLMIAWSTSCKKSL